jgi:hypothetical protein
MRLLVSMVFMPLAAGLALWHEVAHGDEQIAADKRALSPLQPYVGGWRGVGQPKRGSNQGAWTETCEWNWQFEDGRAALVARLDHDKYFASFRVQPAERPSRFEVLATPTGDSKSQRFAGAISGGVLTVADENAPTDRVARISIQLVADGDRMVVLYEKRLGEGAFGRMAEVGSTRSGSSFAKNAASGPECVVTGGLGKVAVEYQGKKYFVCCSGCRDLFNDDPAGVLADYRKRKDSESAERAK